MDNTAKPSIDTMKYNELKALAAEKGLDASGTKEDLIANKVRIVSVSFLATLCLDGIKLLAEVIERHVLVGLVASLASCG